VADVGVSGATSQINATAAGELIVLSAENVVSQFTWFDRAGAPIGTLGEPDDFNTFDVSPDGQRVAVSRDRAGDADLWVMDLGRGGIPTRLNTSARSLYPIWSPDGTQVVFGAGAVANIFRKTIDGGQQEQRLTSSVRTQMPLDWSRDGTHLLIYEVGSPETRRDLLTVPAAATELSAATPYLHGRHNEWWGKFNPTSPPEWVAYQSDESDQWEVYIESFPTPGRGARVSTAGGQYPLWAPDGGELFYVAGGATLMSVSLTYQRDRIVPGTPRPLFRLSAVDTGRSPYDVAPDGKRFLVRAVAPEMGRTLTAIVNWPALLAR
jgi:Tol biopolymer transport system component